MYTKVKMQSAGKMPSAEGKMQTNRQGLFRLITPVSLNITQASLNNVLVTFFVVSSE